MRFITSLVFAAFLFAPTFGDEQQKPVSVITVHEDAENAIAAQKKYGDKHMLYRVDVLKISKDGENFVLTGVGVYSFQLGNFPGSEFKIKKGSEDKFADVKPESKTGEVIVKAKYTGVVRKIGAYKQRVVQFEDAEFIRHPGKDD